MEESASEQGRPSGLQPRQLGEGEVRDRLAVMLGLRVKTLGMKG